MEIDIVDVAGRDFGIVHRDSHGACRFVAAFLKTHAMIRIASRTVTGNLGIDVRAPRLSALEIFEHINPGAFAEHHPGTIARERPRRALRFLVPLCGQHRQQIESRQDTRRQWRIDPAGERSPPWCGEVFGALANGRLLDPRLDIVCRDRRAAPLAYAFVEPVAGAHWVGVDEGRYVEIYEVLAGLPVRVAGTRQVSVANARATFEVTQYDVHGRELVKGDLEAAVAG